VRNSDSLSCRGQQRARFLRENQGDQLANHQECQKSRRWIPIPDSVGSTSISPYTQRRWHPESLDFCLSQFFWSLPKKKRGKSGAISAIYDCFYPRGSLPSRNAHPMDVYPGLRGRHGASCQIHASSGALVGPQSCAG
jgi:hypothetical protein